MPDTPHIAGPSDPEGFSLANFITRLGVVPGPPATFLHDEGGEIAATWRLWRETWFTPHLAPAYVDACLEAVDHRLDAALTGPVAERSRAASAPFLEGKAEMRAHREWRRFAEAIERGDTPGHVAVVHALQSTLYRLPPASALAAYAWFEYQAGSGRRPSADAEPTDDPVFAEILPEVSVAVRGGNGDDEPDSGHLRAI